MHRKKLLITVVCTILSALVLGLTSGRLFAQSNISHDGSFTDSQGRSILYRYWLKDDWDLSQPRQLLIYFHGNSTGTQQERLNTYFGDFGDALDLGLAVAIVASPQSTGGNPADLFGRDFGDNGTRVWVERDHRLVHELLQSGFNSALTIDYDRIVFMGGSQGTSFLARFLERYGGNYGGGFHAWCGSFWGNIWNFPPRGYSPWSPSFPRTPFSSSFLKDRFKVFVQTTTEDFLHSDGLAMLEYYTEVLGLDTRGDLDAPGGHCRRGAIPRVEVWEWLLSGPTHIDMRTNIDTDADGDGMANPVDRDDDNDGAWDFIDALPLDSREWRDTDLDDIGDFTDRDADGDGVSNAADPFSLDPREWRDTDGDGIGDNLDADDDNDGIADDIDSSPSQGSRNDQLAFRRVETGVDFVYESHPSNYPVASVHGRKPASFVYPEPQGDLQSYQFINLGDGANPRFQIMIDRFNRDDSCEAILLPRLCADVPSQWAYFEHYVDKIYVDRNHNGNLTDDGPPLVLARNRGDRWSGPGVGALLEVPYASGETLPYGIILWSYENLSDGVYYKGASTWLGYVETPSGDPVLVGTVDANLDGLFNSAKPGADPNSALVQDLQDFICIDLDRDGLLDECQEDENRYDGTRLNPVRTNEIFYLDGRRYVAAVAPSGHKVEIRSAPVGTESFSIPDRGGRSTTSNGTEAATRSGYGRIRAEPGSTTPSGIAIFGFRQGGVLVAEAGVPASEPVQEGRIFAEVNGPVNTGLAMANPNDEPATIDFYFTEAEGERFGDGQLVLGAHEQTAKFLNQEPFNSGEFGSGTFTFTSSQPIAVIALRGLTNRAGEFLMTTLPVTPLAAPRTPFSGNTGSTDTVYFPHFTDGDGWVTQVTLVNPTDTTITGTVEFLEPGSGATAAAPAVLTLDDGRTGSEFPYSIPAGSSQRFTTSNPSGRVTSGSVRAIPDPGSVAPSGLVVFSFTTGGKTVSESGVPALPAGSAFRVYAESSGTPNQPGSIRTGLAITNAADTDNMVTLEVTGLDGAMTMALAPITLTLPPSGQVARFLDEIFDSLPSDFSGVLRITSTADVAIVGLRLRINTRGELKMTTTPPSDETGPPTTADKFFPHIVDSAGWSTQFILFSGSAGQTSSGTLSFIDTAGAPWNLPTAGGVSEGVTSGGGTGADLVVESSAVSDASLVARESFTFSATVRNQGTGQAAATTLRYYRSSDATISMVDTEVGRDAVSALAAAGTSSEEITLTAPSTAGTYYYGACVDPVSGESNSQNNCSSVVRVSVSARQMEIEGFDLASANGNPEGIVFANDRFFVVDREADKVYAYQSSGQRDSASEFDLDSANEDAFGIAFANNRFYVVDTGDDKVFAYRSSGQRDSASDFDLDSANGNARGITFANDKFYVVDDRDGLVYAYQSSGQRDSASDFDLDFSNESARGIAFANNRFYVVDDRDGLVYAYDASGQRASAYDVNLDLDNRNATGITFANGSVYLVDWVDNEVYVLNPTDPQATAYDLAISSATLHAPSPASIGDPISMSVTVVNRGPIRSQPAKLHFGGSTYRDIPALDLGVTTMFIRVEVGNVRIGTLTFRACIVEAPGEGNPANNCEWRSVTYGAP